MEAAVSPSGGALKGRKPVFDWLVMMTPTPTTTCSAPSLVAAETGCGAGRRTVAHFIHGIGGGGAESMLRALVKALDRRRWRIVVVVMQADAWPKEAEEMRQAVDAFHVLNESSLMSGRTLKRLAALLRVERVEVLHTWMHHADFAGGIAARMAGVRRVVWGIHCREITRAPGEAAWKAALFRWLMPLAARVLPSRIVSCSQVALEDHVAMGYPRSSMVWIPNGVDPGRYHPDAAGRDETRSRLSLTEEHWVVGYAGRFHEMKNLPLLLEAFALLRSRQPQARLLMCGVTEPELDAGCRQLVARAGGQEAVRLLPFQAEMERFYPAMDVFSLSSRTEACPMTMLEAMACGVPCVTTDVGDCRALMGETGYVSPADAEALCQAWVEILGEDETARQARSTAARARVLERFAVARAAEAHARLYESLLPVTKGGATA